MDRRSFIVGGAAAGAGLLLPRLGRSEECDLVFAGAKALIDGEFKVCDLGVRGERIAAVTDPGCLTGAKVIPGADLYVSPGWTDLHVHYVDWGHRKSAGSTIDRLGIGLGVTALVDAGTTGCRNFDRLENTVADYPGYPCRAFLNIKRDGIKLSSFYFTRNGWDEIPAMEPVVEANRHRIVGLKVRADNSVTDPRDRLYYVRKIREAGDRFHLPSMIHIGSPPPRVEEILPLMKEGDMLTHFLRGQGNSILDANGKVSDVVKDAYARGVKFDLGHGAGSYEFETAERAWDQGFTDFTVSSDLYIVSQLMHAKTFANVLTNLLCAGMPLADVMVRASTKPAEFLGLEREIRPGAEATLSVFSLANGDFTCTDVTGKKRQSEKRIIPEWTVMKGELHRAGDIDRHKYL